MKDEELSKQHTDALLQTTLTKKELDKALYNLWLRSHTSFEEQGVITLFLAVGLLRWFEPTSPPEGRLAPIYLLPVFLSRPGVGRPFILRAAPEDPQVNPSLLRKLEVEYGVKVPIPETEEGIDPDALLSAFKAARPDPRWQVLSDMHLGLFSFSKYIMYRDLEDQAGALLENRLVGRLAGTAAAEASPPPPAPEELDRLRPPAEVHQILDADSSQQLAIETVRRGSDLVLQGPPGTGKSQTIANLIAESLAEGKTVLFVSEKMAALEVVKKRLDRAGLGDYVLELHSRYAAKRDVVMELKRCLERDRLSAPPGDDAAARLPAARAVLDGYVAALHEPFGKGGQTPYEAHATLARLAAVADVLVPVEAPEDLPPDARLDLRRRLTEYALAGTAVEPFEEHPYRFCRLTSVPRATEVELASRLDSLARLAADLGTKAAARAGELGLPAPADLAGAESLVKLLGHLAHTPRPEGDWLADPAWPGTSPEGRAIAARCRKFRDGREVLAKSWTDGLYALALDDLAARRHRAGTGLLRFFRPSWWRDRLLLKTALRPGAARSAAEIIADLDLAIATRDAGNAMDAGATRATEIFGRFFRRRETSPEDLDGLIGWVGRLREMVPGAVPPALAAAAGEPKRHDGPLAEVREALRLAREESAQVATLLGAEALPDGLPGLADWAAAARARIEEVHAAATFRRAEAACAEAKLAPFLEAAGKHGLAPGHLADAFEKCAATLLIDRVRAARPALRNFDRGAHEEAIRRFCALDAASFAGASGRLRARLDESLPSARSFSPQSDVGLLLREAAKKRRHLPIRTLLDRAGVAVRKLKPCFMMGPLSVAQFLPVGSAPFDIVVFDEASQICPEDAVGAIARGRRLVVVGDSKQLPPTSFFAYDPDTGKDEENEEAPPDLESVLDLAASSGFPSLRLRWHYRSRDESLIAFSNHHFYDDALYTFPGPGGDRGLGVAFHHVPDGVYDRGGSRDNRVEARAVAAGIAAQLEAAPELSVGGVAFSEAQQRAVLDELERLMKARPGLEELLANRADEPFFMKNLENVQGDERDVMFFSVGYGRDGAGKLTMNFGPLNGEGGHRRLNVAVTRARCAVKVYASVLPEEIDPARTTSRGAALLRDYLAYARDGARAAAAGGSGEPTAVEASIATALTAEGLRVARRLGASNWRLDLAVASPDAPERWLLGIVCDGPNYRMAATTRDRDRTRPEVLSRLGWRIVNVWSPDWIRSPAKEKERLLAELKAAIADAARAEPPPVAEPPPGAPVAGPLTDGPLTEDPPAGSPPAEVPAEEAAAAPPPAPDPKPNAKKAPAPVLPEGPPPYSITPASKLRVRGPFSEANESF
ncbi:MAG: DUF4011 domain-containing protein, partial [Planctomycetes bacterium]|nr:DUF4011 domain-containing protein [Planctomycetota bacterium]